MAVQNLSAKLHYRIDSAERRWVRLSLEDREKKRILYLSTLKEIAQEEERKPLNLLIQERVRKAVAGLSKDTLSFSQIDLDPNNAAEILPLLVPTGRLFYDRSPIKQVVHGILEWKGERLSETACCLEAILCYGQQKISLSACSCLFPTFVIHEGTLILAPIGKITVGPFVLEGRSLRNFLEDHSVQLKENQEVGHVIPQLILKGASGCCAELWMDYSNLGRISFSDPSPHICFQKRALATEKKWEQDLLDVGYIRMQDKTYFCSGDKVADALALLLGIGWQIQNEQGKQVVHFQDWHLELSEKKESFVLRMNQNTRAALSAVKRGRSWVDLEGGRIGWIDRKNALRMFGGILEEIDSEDEVHLNKQKILDCQPFLEQKTTSLDPALREKMGSLFLQKEWKEALPTPLFKGNLLSYQQVGVNWLSHLHQLGFGGLLADEMGLGKTVQLLAFFSRLRTNLPVLIVAPTSLVYHWHSEIQRFLPQSVIYLHVGDERRKSLLDLTKTPYILTSYAILRRDEELFNQLEYEVVVLDESSQIKNSRSRTLEVVLQLRSQSRFCINGTPIENRAEELSAQFSFLMPSLLKPTDPPEVMKRKVRPLLLRRSKKEVELELPDKVEQIAYVEMNETQKALYQEVQKAALTRLKPKVAQEGAGKYRMEILEAILRLRQICCDPRLMKGVEGENREPGSKFEQVMNDLEELLTDGRKVLLYSQFTSMLDLIQAAACKQKWNTLRLDGSTSSSERGDLVDHFQKEEQATLFLLSLKAGGVGLNLTAAEYVLLYDPWWNEAVERQAIDRVHRIGQKKNVFIKRYLTPDSVEEKMLGLKKAKQTTADQILESSDLESYSAEEWFALLDDPSIPSY